MWPAFWMMGESIASTPWPGCGEIDVMEVMSRGGPLDDNIVLSTAHWLNDANNSHAQYGLTDTSATPLADSFHVYSTTWDPRYIRSYIDGRQFWVIDITPGGLSEFHQPFYLLLNAAVGGTPLNITDPAAVTATLPQTMLVDYVRVYKEATGTETGIVNRRGIEALSVIAYHTGAGVSLLLTLSRGASDPEVSVYTVSGKRIAGKRFSCSPGTTRVEVPARLSQGVYLLEMTTRTGCLRKLFSVSSAALSR
jgi:beta-glucanase (GH16 family)